MNKRIAILLSSFLLLLLVVTPVFARQPEVLAESTQAATLTVSPTTQGPGLILPNSPLFFMDQWFQALKLAVATTPEAKAKVRAQIIGERMAELKIMLSLNNEKEINKALQNLTEESNQGAKDLLKESNKGTNVEEAAKVLNEAIKQERDALTALDKQSTGSLASDFQSAKEKAKIHKSAVVDKLPASLIQREVESDLENDVRDKAEEVHAAALDLEDHLAELHKEATSAAKEAQDRRLEAIKKAIETKNEALKKQTEAELKAEEVRQEALKKEQEKLLESAKKAAEAAGEVRQQTETTIQESHNGDSSNSGDN